VRAFAAKGSPAGRIIEEWAIKIAKGYGKS